MSRYYLAVDIGASGGRHMLGHMENGTLQLEEIYRFENGMKKIGGHLCWDLKQLFSDIVAGLKACKEAGKIPSVMGIDTWAVDYVLLDQENQILGQTYGYRDKRTTGMDQKVYEVISEEKLYERTGIQKQIFNTIYQLMSVKEQEPEVLKKAKQLLLLPDYFNFLLTGVKKTEYTNATTTQLVSPVTKDWDWELIEMLGYPAPMFGEISMAGTFVGRLTNQLKEELGFDLDVIQVATHDTASAVLAVPAKGEDFLYVSSGTWSLMGVEQREANCSRQSRNANLTNEGGYEYRFRFLKNIMGLWMIQSVRKEWKEQYSYAHLCSLAAECDDFPSRVDVNEEVFLAPECMTEAIRECCKASGQRVPETAGELAAVVYKSLAESYGRTVKEIEEITGKTYKSIHIVGGGASAEYLNQLTADATGKTVYCGPTEATAIGNVAVQMLREGVFSDLEEARACIYKSFEMKKYDSRSVNCFGMEEK